jgi:monofunctional biosynthetic peptidoglycan transglycosylase
MKKSGLVFDFNAQDEATSWNPINDVIMGGVSRSTLRILEPGIALFSGNVSLANSGGFASIRSGTLVHDFTERTGIELRIRGDGKIYKLNLKTGEAFEGVQYQIPVPTRKGIWDTLKLPFRDFRPIFRGVILPGHSPLDPGKISSIGFVISDRQEGEFQLEIDWIKTY